MAKQHFDGDCFDLQMRALTRTQKSGCNDFLTPEGEGEVEVGAEEVGSVSFGHKDFLLLVEEAGMMTVVGNSFWHEVLKYWEEGV